MYFLRKKKQLRDRDAGLVFHWRGAKKHYMAKFYAVMVAVGCFGFIAYAVRVEGPKQPLISKRTSTLVMLNEDDPNCRKLMMQIEEKSPFPSRWDPAYDSATNQRVAKMADSIMGKAWEYQPALRELPPRSNKSTQLTPILDSGAGLVSGFMHHWWRDLEILQKPTGSELFVRGIVTVEGKLNERLILPEWILPANLVAEDWFGQSFRFMLSVDEQGVVRSCVPLPGGSMGTTRATDLQKGLAVWVRAQHFKPSEQSGVVFGELQLQIKVTREK